MTLTDQVESIHVMLYTDKTYRKNLQRQGSLADDVRAARMIRTKAKEIGSPVADELLSDITKAFRTVLRRYDTKTPRSLAYGD